ncbi:Protocadherin Fat 1 [Trichinella zimbabwensis]|uniref:Protocadherin Fat 1 n=1 Tax=Trichinella zimbabwensis TaxID=268475 RepID=A0A0V1HVI0_9BILA|nr:Protocadherin Fat 1 [Trichinella zimbabwensis]
MLFFFFKQSFACSELTGNEYNPCQNGGTYYASLRGNICLCKWPYKGSYCEGLLILFLMNNFSKLFINFRFAFVIYIYIYIYCALSDKFLCYVKPCLNNGACKSDNLTHYSCECRMPYWGKRCERINYCLTDENPCNNGGTCIKVNDLYNCICPPGYAGIFCRTDYAASYRLYISIGTAVYLLVTTAIFCCVFIHCSKVYNNKFELLEIGLLSESVILNDVHLEK